MEGHPCLDELHESRKIQALIKIGPDKDIQAPIKIGTGDMQETVWTDSGQSEQKKVTRKTRSPDLSGKMQPGHYNRNVTAALFPEC